jgi:arginine utilization regulatory protein
MVSYDIICFLDENNIVKHFECRNLDNDAEYQGIQSEYNEKNINSFLDIDLNKGSGYTSWKGMMLRFIKTANIMGTGSILYLTGGAGKSKIYEAAMDCISDGIQIYDRNGHLVFCNKVSARIEKMDRAKIVGKHLLDIYELNEDYSTILNTLAGETPVANRCDNFKNGNGQIITTINSGCPLFFANQLIGAVGLVQDMSVLEGYQVKANVFEKFLAEQESKKRSGGQKGYYTLKYYSFNDLIGQAESFVEAINLSRNMAARDCAVLIYGETGTGKELFAQSIHSGSNRKNAEFIAVNCAAIPESLIEGILFGTEKGTFTGSSDRMGLFEQAQGGTLFLDEINSMDLHVQSKLLRVLQERKFRRVGGLKDIECTARIISSTNEEPSLCIAANKLRKDLYYRISTVTVNVPPLRQRLDDIEILTNYFIDKLSRRYGKQVNKATGNVIKIFKEYNWPGNVRELLHVIEHSFNTMTGHVIDACHLPKYMQGCTDDIAENELDRKDSLHPKTLEELMDKYEKEVITVTLQRNQANVTRAAQVLGIKRQSLQYRLKKYGL